MKTTEQFVKEATEGNKSLAKKLLIKILKEKVRNKITSTKD